jgi:pimeloyl-ACP methyl ester carboxylesterase
MMLKRYWWFWLLLVLFVAGMGVVGWAANVPSPMPEALAALRSDARVTVESDPWLVFRPAKAVPSTGLIFYPGGRVDHRAYAPALRALAAEGYLVVLTPMPLNLAVLAPNRASAVMAAFPEIGRWVVGGHSLGGAMAAHFALTHPDETAGLALWAAYPAAGDRLETLDLEVVSIYATRDGLATPDQVLGALPQLPPGTRFVAIEGGNHAQFGWYGPQAGDNPALLNRADQQARVIEATLALLRQVDARP